jgi:hypothetical protein
MKHKIIVEVFEGVVSNVINLPENTEYIVLDWDVLNDYEIIENLGITGERLNFYEKMINDQNLSFEEIVNMAIGEIIELTDKE